MELTAHERRQLAGIEHRLIPEEPRLQRALSEWSIHTMPAGRRDNAPARALVAGMLMLAAAGVGPVVGGLAVSAMTFAELATALTGLAMVFVRDGRAALRIRSQGPPAHRPRRTD